MLKHPYDFRDRTFEIKTLKIREIANALILKYELNIRIQGNLALEDSGNNFNFFVRDEQTNRVMLLQSSYEIPGALKEEIIDEYNMYLYSDQWPG
jgi:hypothetical protein